MKRERRPCCSAFVFHEQINATSPLPSTLDTVSVNRRFASFQPSTTQVVESLTFDAIPPHLLIRQRSFLVPSLIVFSGKRARERKRDSNFPIFRPALFPRTNENSWPYSMINAATVCRFIQKCMCVCICMCVDTCAWPTLMNSNRRRVIHTHTRASVRCESLKCYWSAGYVVIIVYTKFYKNLF